MTILISLISRLSEGGEEVRIIISSAASDVYKRQMISRLSEGEREWRLSFICISNDYFDVNFSELHPM